MSTELYIAAAGFIWWAFFEWMRHWKRKLQRGTQHLVLIGALGLIAGIFGLCKFLFDRII